MEVELFGISVLDWVIVAVYALVILSLGLLAGRSVKTREDYFLGGRRLGMLFMVAQSFSTSTRPDQAVAVIGASAQLGLAGIWYQWIYLFSTPFYWLIGPIYRRLRYVTVGDFFERRYGKSMGIAYAVGGLAFFSVNIGTMLKGTGITIEAVTRGAIPVPIAVFVLVVFFLAYGLFGGFMAFGSTQTIQGLLILVLSFLLIPFAISEAGGFSMLRSSLPGEVNWFSLVADEEVTLFFIIMAVINGLVGVVVQPHHMAMNGAARDEISCRSGWTGGSFLKRVTTIGWAFTGIFAAAVFPALVSGTHTGREYAFGMAIASLLPSGFVGLMLAAMVAAVVAGCHVFMVNGSALFTHHFVDRFNLKKRSLRHQELAMARLGAVGIVVGSAISALFLPTVIDGLLLIWKIMAFLGISFWGAILWRGANRYGAWSSLIVATTLAFWAQNAGWSFPEQVALYLPAGIISLILVSLFTRPEAKELLDTFYNLLRTPVGKEYLLVEKNPSFRASIIPIPIQSTPSPAMTAVTPENLFTSSIISNSLSLAQTEPSSEKESSVEWRGEPAITQAHEQSTAHQNHLLLVDLLTLRRQFSIKRYFTDLVGFTVSWGIVFVYLLFLFVLAYWCKTF